MKSQVPFSLLGFLVFKPWMFCQLPAKWFGHLWVIGIEGEQEGASPFIKIFILPLWQWEEGSGKGVQWLWGWGGVSSSSGVFWFQGPETHLDLLPEKDLTEQMWWNVTGPQGIRGQRCCLKVAIFFWRCFCYLPHDSLCWVTPSPLISAWLWSVAEPASGLTQRFLRA